MYVADRNLYLNSDKSMVVAEGSPAAAYLLVAAGCQVTDAVVKKYNIGLEDLDAVEEEEVFMEKGVSGVTTLIDTNYIKPVDKTAEDVQAELAAKREERKAKREAKRNEDKPKLGPAEPVKK